MVFDAQRGVLVLFGGNSGAELNQTWELTGTTWTDRTASLTGSPPAQSGGRLAYDAARQRVVLTGNGSYPTQTWEYAGTGWTSGAGLMASAAWGGLAYDEVRQRLVATGSGVNGGKPQELIAGTWQDRTPAAGPIARGDSAMVFDDRRGHAVLFGGWTNSPPTYFADTWELRNTSWVRRSPPASPPGRYGHMMAYDRARDIAWWSSADSMAPR
jgi:hypothetical protein